VGWTWRLGEVNRAMTVLHQCTYHLITRCKHSDRSLGLLEFHERECAIMRSDHVRDRCTSQGKSSSCSLVPTTRCSKPLDSLRYQSALHGSSVYLSLTKIVLPRFVEIPQYLHPFAAVTTKCHAQSLPPYVFHIIQGQPVI